MGLLTKRSTILGLPIGPSQVDWKRIAAAGGAVAVAVAGDQGRRKARQASEQLKEPLQQGKKALGEAAEIGEDVSNATERVSEGGGLLGKATSMFGGSGGNSEGGGESGGYTKKLRLVIKEHQDVAVPRPVAYNQWTQYPDFPQFMKGVVSVEPEDEVTQKWTAKVGPSRRTWSAQVTEQVPDERIQWEGSEGAEHFGIVTFHEFDDNLTRVQVEMEYHPNGFVEKVGNLFLAARMRVRKDLRLFKHYVELENEETGAWRGEISEGEVAAAGEEAGEPEPEEAGEPVGSGQQEGADEEQPSPQEEVSAEGDGDRRRSGERAGEQEDAQAEPPR